MHEQAHANLCHMSAVQSTNQRNTANIVSSVAIFKTCFTMSSWLLLVIQLFLLRDCE